jgi:DNA-binding NarL/FixJ family response regulator
MFGVMPNADWTASSSSLAFPVAVSGSIGEITRVRRDDPIERLTPRQREVLALMAEGRSNQAIAKQLTLTEKAVVKHVSHVYGELDLPACPDDHRRVLAVVRYLASESAATF